MPAGPVPKRHESVTNAHGLRGRILKAAQELFSEKGYRATTTKEISVRAGVAEPSLFRHFGSKVDLFEASILEPFTAFVDRWTRSWINLATQISLEELADDLVDGLYTLVRQDRRVFQELIAARWDPHSDLYPAAIAVSAHLRLGFSAVHDVGLDIAGERSLFDVDPPANIGAVASMIIGSVLLEDWVYPANKRIPGKTRMVREMTKLIVDGISHRGD